MWPHDDQLLFRDVAECEHNFGFKSTFMFAAISRYDAGASPYDVAYSIKLPSVRSAMEYVQHGGSEIGLHASYDAYKSIDCFERERTRLAKAAGCPVSGLRHHFWHTGRDVERTLLFHEQAGFTYDSSIAWNERVGFRRSVAAPYRPWNSAKQREINVLQLPVCIMDGNLFYEEGMSVELAIQQMIAAVTELLKHGGLGVVDWHSDASHPKTPRYKKWGKAYFEFLGRLSQIPQLWVTNLGEIADWLQNRERHL
jgi:hypothetical protein